MSESGSAREAPRSKRGRATRAALLQAGRRVLERDGFVDAKIADISAEAGVAVGSFYTHFRDKDDLFAALVEETTAVMLHPGVAEVARDADPATMIADANRAYLESYRENAKLMALLEQVAAIDERFRKLREERSHAFHARNAAAIRRLQRSKMADRAVDPDIAAIALSAMVSRAAYGAFVLEVLDPDVDRLADTLTRMWVNSLSIKSHGT
jgi:AcrR family transcriptional regulator